LVKTSGNTTGESLVMIHGWGMNSGVWESIRSELESEYLVIWIDLPGYGINSNIVAKSMKDIISLILPQLPDNTHLLGWSLGGLVVQAIANELVCTNQADKLKSLTLVASSAKFSQSDDWQHAITKIVLSNFSQSLQEDIQGTLRRFVALQFMGVKGTRDIQKKLIDGILLNTAKYKMAKKGGGDKICTNTPHYQALSLGLEILKNADYRKVSHKIPKHWILADKDRLIPPAVINDLQFLYPDDQITLLENAGHAPFMTSPDEFFTCMNSFIKSHS